VTETQATGVDNSNLRHSKARSIVDYQGPPPDELQAADVPRFSMRRRKNHQNIIFSVGFFDLVYTRQRSNEPIRSLGQVI
jgi:hypothetical protein